MPVQEGDGAFKRCNTRWGILPGHLKEYAGTSEPSPRSTEWKAHVGRMLPEASQSIG